jgi:hypothetical protein
LLAEKHGKEERYFTYKYLGNTAVENNSFGHAVLFLARAIQAQPAQLVRLSTVNFMFRVLVRVLGARSLARKIRVLGARSLGRKNWTPTTFWEFVEQIDSGLEVEARREAAPGQRSCHL